MIKKDFKKELKEFYHPSTRAASVVKVPAMDFVMIDGKGDPNHNLDFQAAAEALFTFSYTLKYSMKMGQAAVDYGVMPLEGLWWAEDINDFDPERGNRANWLWTLMIMQPYITDEVFAETVEAVKKKKSLTKIDELRLERFNEGKSVQIMHVGSFSAEGPNIKKLHDYIHSVNAKPSGKHHEIYLSDFRRVAPEKMKTVLRQPFLGK